MNPLEFDLVWIFHDKLCFKESNQNLSRVLLRIGFFTSEKNEQGFSRRWYTSMYSFSSLSWLISHFSLSNFSLKDSHSVFAKSNPSSSSLIFFSVVVFFFERLETIHLCLQITHFFVNCFYIPFQIFKFFQHLLEFRDNLPRHIQSVQLVHIPYSVNYDS